MHASMHALLATKARGVRVAFMAAAKKHRVSVAQLVAAGVGLGAPAAAKEAAVTLSPEFFEGLDEWPTECPACSAVAAGERTCIFCKAAYGCPACVPNNAGCAACRAERKARTEAEKSDA